MDLLDLEVAQDDQVVHDRHEPHDRHRAERHASAAPRARHHWEHGQRAVRGDHQQSVHRRVVRHEDHVVRQSAERSVQRAQRQVPRARVRERRRWHAQHEEQQVRRRQREHQYVRRRSGEPRKRSPSAAEEQRTQHECVTYTQILVE